MATICKLRHSLLVAYGIINVVDLSAFSLGEKLFILIVSLEFIRFQTTLTDKFEFYDFSGVFDNFSTNIRLKSHLGYSVSATYIQKYLTKFK